MSERKSSSNHDNGASVTGESGEFCQGLVQIFWRDADNVIGDKFVMPDILGDLASPGQQDLNFTFKLNALENSNIPEEWTILN